MCPKGQVFCKNKCIPLGKLFIYFILLHLKQLNVTECGENEKFCHSCDKCECECLPQHFRCGGKCIPESKLHFLNTFIYELK